MAALLKVPSYLHPALLYNKSGTRIIDIMPCLSPIGFNLIKQEINDRMKCFGCNPLMPPLSANAVSDFHRFCLFIHANNRNGANWFIEILWHNRPLVKGKILIGKNLFPQCLLCIIHTCISRPGQILSDFPDQMPSCDTLPQHPQSQIFLAIVFWFLYYRFHNDSLFIFHFLCQVSPQ